MKKVFYVLIVLICFSLTLYSCDDGVNPDLEGTGNTVSEGSIVYGFLESGTWKICIIQPNGSSNSVVTDAGGTQVKGIAWSPGRDWIVFSSNVSGAYELYKVKRNSTLFTQITFDGALWLGVGNIYPCWVNSSELLYTTCRTVPAQKEIVRINIDGSNLTLLSNVHFIINSYQFPCLVGSSRLVFSKGDVGSPASSQIWTADYCCFGNQFLVADVDGSASGDFYPDYSSNKIVFSNDNGNIYIVNLDGTNLMDISTVSNVIDREPRFSPNGSQIAFISNQSGVDNIWIMNNDGTNRTLLTTTIQSGAVESLDW